MGVSVSKGIWVARLGDIKASYSENRFGALAEQLAERAFSQMTAGTFDKVRDDFELRQTYSMKEAAMLLGMTEGKLHHWIMTGQLDGREIRPPQKDTARGFKDRFSGYEVTLTKERITA